MCLSCRHSSSHRCLFYNASGPVLALDYTSLMTNHTLRHTASVHILRMWATFAFEPTLQLYMKSPLASMKTSPCPTINAPTQSSESHRPNPPAAGLDLLFDRSAGRPSSHRLTNRGYLTCIPVPRVVMSYRTASPRVVTSFFLFLLALATVRICRHMHNSWNSMSLTCACDFLTSFH
jgi:hypothetical protein